MNNDPNNESGKSHYGKPQNKEVTEDIAHTDPIAGEQKTTNLERRMSDNLKDETVDMNNDNGNTVEANEDKEENLNNSKSVIEFTEMLVKHLNGIMYKLLALKLDCNIGITCDSCGDESFTGYRYKCCFCNDYDLCSDCFESKKCALDHLPHHPVFFIPSPLTPKESLRLTYIFSLGPEVLSILFDESVHDSISCDACELNPIRGIRVKCDDCIDYDLCWSCFNNKKLSKTHTLSHSVVAHLVPIRKVFEPEKDIKYSSDTKKSEGCFGSVQKVYYNGKKSAMKTIKLTGKRDDVLLESFRNELFAYSEIHSNHILKFYGRATKRREDCDVVELYLLMEFMEKGSIKDVIERNEAVSLRRKLQWVLDIIKGIRRIHSKGFVHKDIKPDNILVNSCNKVKIGDMGIAIYDKGKGYFRERIAPPYYSAPEIIFGKFNNKVDIFSYGLVVYEIFTYKQREVENAFLDLILPVHFPEVSKVFMPLIEKCVSRDPNKRPTAIDIEKKLQKFSDEFWSSLKISQRDYIKSSTEEKDRLFMEYYTNCAEEKLVFGE